MPRKVRTCPRPVGVNDRKLPPRGDAAGAKQRKRALTVAARQKAELDPKRLAQRRKANAEYMLRKRQKETS